ncbi:MAG: tetratricopeptide repeat protein [Thermodesulfobacteriota bacterium]
MRFVLLLLFCCLCLPWSSASASDDPDLAAGKELLRQGDFAAARDRLFAAFLKDPDRTEINFLLGRAAYEAGDYESAVMAFDRVLIVDPGAMRVRLELARCHLALGNLEAARQLLQEVRNTNPPSTVLTNINALLAVIDARSRRHALHGSLSLGYSRDDNVRVAPADDLVRVYLNNVLIDTTAERPKEDNILAATLGLDHVYQTERQGLLWRSALVAYQSVHQFENDQEVSYLSLQSGPFWQKRNHSFELHPILAHLDLDQRRYLGSFGGEAVWSWLPRANFVGQLGVRLESRRYYQDHERDAVRQSCFLNSYLQLGKSRLTGNLAAAFENAESDVHSNDAYTVGLRLDHDLTATLTGFAAAACTDTRHDGVHPMFLERRRDRETMLAAGLRKMLWQAPGSARQLLGEAGYTFTDTDSNLALYTYDKNVLSLLFTLRF